MKVLFLIICCALFLSNCTQTQPPLDPIIARLVGTWTLAKPDSATGTTLVFSLDTANPPHDITAFDVQGQGLQSRYSGRMYATIDGTMQLQQISQSATAATSTINQQLDEFYLTKLQSVARYNQPTDSTLTLYYGRPFSGTLFYKKSR